MRSWLSRSGIHVSCVHQGKWRIKVSNAQVDILRSKDGDDDNEGSYNANQDTLHLTKPRILSNMFNGKVAETYSRIIRYVFWLSINYDGSPEIVTTSFIQWLVHSPNSRNADTY